MHSTAAIVKCATEKDGVRVVFKLLIPDRYAKECSPCIAMYKEAGEEERKMFTSYHVLAFGPPLIDAESFKVEALCISPRLLTCKKYRR